MNKTKTIGEALEVVNKILEENWNKPKSEQRIIDKFALRQIMVNAFSIFEKDVINVDTFKNQYLYSPFPKIAGSEIHMDKLGVYLTGKRKKSKISGKLIFFSIEFEEGWEKYKDMSIFDKIEQQIKMIEDYDGYKIVEVKKQQNEFLGTINQLGITIADFDKLHNQYKYFSDAEIQNLIKEQQAGKERD